MGTSAIIGQGVDFSHQLVMMRWPMAATVPGPALLLSLLLVLVAHPLATHAAPRARLQETCGCEHCVSTKGNTVADCESFGLDCSCYAGCPCATCVHTKGNTVADCESFGIDCACYSGGGGGGGACDDLADRTAAVNDECCDEPTEDCSSGRPATCNVGCAHVLLPFFDDCAGVLGTTGAGLFDDVVALCHAAEAGPPPAPVSARGCLVSVCMLEPSRYYALPPSAAVPPDALTCFRCHSSCVAAADVRRDLRPLHGHGGRRMLPHAELS